jgi:hypothetical protein
MVGGLDHPEASDHLDNEAKTVKPVNGTAKIDVDEIRTQASSKRAEDPPNAISC